MTSGQNRFVVGEGWGTAALIEDDNANDATAPRVSSDANGNALAVWNNHRNGGEPFAARYAIRGGWVPRLSSTRRMTIRT